MGCFGSFGFRDVEVEGYCSLSFRFGDVMLWD